MATSKTLAPTNVTISIPAMTDAPNASVISNCIDKEADAINALNSQIVKILKTKTISATSDSNSTIDLALSNAYIVYSVYTPDMTNVAAIPYLHNNAWRARLINATTGAALSEAARYVTIAYIET